MRLILEILRYITNASELASERVSSAAWKNKKKKIKQIVMINISWEYMFIVHSVDNLLG